MMPCFHRHTGPSTNVGHFTIEWSSNSIEYQWNVIHSEDDNEINHIRSRWHTRET